MTFPAGDGRRFLKSKMDRAAARRRPLRQRRSFFEPLEDRSMLAIAYVVPAGTAGNQNYGGSLGLAFDVNVPITITDLGAFDDGSDGLKSVINVRIFDRTNTATPLA